MVLTGAIGAFYPFAGKDELDFFQHLEMFVRAEKPPLCGREHIMRPFMSYINFIRTNDNRIRRK